MSNTRERVVVCTAAALAAVGLASFGLAMARDAPAAAVTTTTTIEVTTTSSERPTTTTVEPTTTRPPPTTVRRTTTTSPTTTVEPTTTTDRACPTSPAGPADTVPAGSARPTSPPKPTAAPSAGSGGPATGMVVPVTDQDEAVEPVQPLWCRSQRYVVVVPASSSAQADQAGFGSVAGFDARDAACTYADGFEGAWVVAVDPRPGDDQKKNAVPICEEAN